MVRTFSFDDWSNRSVVRHRRCLVTEADARFNAITARNYNDLWFYSTPVFVTVGS